MPALKTIYTILSVVILSAIAGLVIMTTRYNRAFMDTSDAVHHTLTVLDHTQHALSAVLDLDLGKDSTAVIHQIRELKRITADNPLQQLRADSLLSSISVFEHQGTDGAYLRTGYTNRLRSILLAMQREENRLLALREKANATSRGMLRSAIFILLVFIFVLLCVSLFLILYNLRRRKIAESGLRESERRFSLLVQHVKDYAIYMIDRQGNVMTWNQGAENMKGYTASEIIGKPISLFYTDEDNQKGEPLDNLEKAALLGRHESIGWRKRKDGTLFWADVVMTPLYDEKEELSGYIKITRDITDQQKAEEEMKMALLREKDLNEMKSRFVTLASHEFKTPLSVILSSTSLIEKYSAPEMADKRLRHIQRIKSNVKNLRQILGDFLSLEKLEEGVVRNDPSPVNLIEISEEIIADMEGSCKTGQKINLEIIGEPRVVSMDDLLLRNILNNLLSNAVKYSPEQTLVRFTLEFEPGMVRFTVTDSGIGIPPEEQEHLFERFFRASNTSGVGGTGLGLSIVKKYLDLMEGRISVTSEPGKGTTFTVTIPGTEGSGHSLSGLDKAHLPHELPPEHERNQYPA